MNKYFPLTSTKRVIYLKTWKINNNQTTVEKKTFVINAHITKIVYMAACKWNIRGQYGFLPIWLRDVFFISKLKTKMVQSFSKLKLYRCTTMHGRTNVVHRAIIVHLYMSIHKTIKNVVHQLFIIHWCTGAPCTKHCSFAQQCKIMLLHNQGYFGLGVYKKLELYLTSLTIQKRSNKSWLNIQSQAI